MPSKHMKKYNVLVFLTVSILFFGTTLVFGQQGKRLTLSDCLKMAHQQNPGLLTYRESLIALQHKEESLFREMLPDVSVSWSGKEVYENYTDAYAASVSVNQTVFQGKRAYTSWKISGLETRRSSCDLIRQYQYMTYRVKNAWYELLKTQELLEETIQSLERLKQHASNAGHFFKEGWIWRTDVLEAQVKVARGEQAKIVAENNVARAIANLNILMHRDVNAELSVQEKLIWIPHEWTFEKAKAEALKNRPDLLQAHIDLEKSQLALTIERSSYYPNVSATAAWSRSDRHMDMHNGVEDLSAQMTASWTLWEWGKTIESVAAAKANVRKNKLLIQEIEDQLILDIQEAWLSVQESDKKLNVLEQALAQGEENYRVNIIRYRERLGTAKNVLDAQDLLTSTREDYITALSVYLSSLANLDYAIGTKKYDIYQ
ncbi:MAG: TolC family protein [Candidatus Magnetomorum sp.]|nr:TolC family protein [Candidatus Magnetomorum sp.]